MTRSERIAGGLALAAVLGLVGAGCGNDEETADEAAAGEIPVAQPGEDGLADLPTDDGGGGQAEADVPVAPAPEEPGIAPEG